MSEPDTILRAVEIHATIADVRHLADDSVTIRIHSDLQFSVIEKLPLENLRKQRCKVLIVPDLIGEDTEDAAPLRPTGKTRFTPGQELRFMLEELARRSGHTNREDIEDYYQAEMGKICDKYRKILVEHQ